MSNEKTFTLVGVSCKNGQYKVRFANSVSRVKVLTNDGHTDIFFIQLDGPAAKEVCIGYLCEYMTTEDCELNENQRAAIVEYASEMS